MIGFLIAIISGALMSIQGVLNSQVTKTTGIWVSNVWVQFSALLICLAVWAITDRTSLLTIVEVKPRYMLIGGIIGAGITWTVIKSIEQLDPAKAILFIVIAQMIVSYVIELMGLFQVEKQPLEGRKIIGMSIAFIGVYLFQSSK